MIDISEYNFEVSSSDIRDIAHNFICKVCKSAAISPVKCSNCETIICRTCVPSKKCGCSSAITDLGRIERNILDSLAFRCKCKAVVQY